MITFLGQILTATVFAICGALEEEAVKTNSRVGGNFVVAGNVHFSRLTFNKIYLILQE